MEFIHSYPKLEYMAYPRLMAVAETGWSDGRKDFSHFSERLSHNLIWLDRKGINFRIPDVICHTSKEIEGDQFDLVLHPPVEGATIYYTLDGEDPMQFGKPYRSPVKVYFGDREDLLVKYMIRTVTGRVSGTRTLNFRKK